MLHRLDIQKTDILLNVNASTLGIEINSMLFVYKNDAHKQLIGNTYEYVYIYKYLNI